MINLLQLENYRENNRIEAKLALGGLPHSIWETYSAFANTLGGIILLGVEELKDRSLRAVNLPNPESLIQEFWEKVNDAKIVSVNVLKKEDVEIKVVDGNSIVTITVPPANEDVRPVLANGIAYYRRGESDLKW